MKTNFYLVNDADDYKDVDVYVKRDTGEEWLFRVYLEKETGEIVECDARHAKDENDAFGDEVGGEPTEVRSAYELVKNQVIEKLRGEAA
jgi:hypothetical protein